MLVRITSGRLYKWMNAVKRTSAACVELSSCRSRGVEASHLKDLRTIIALDHLE